MDTPLFSYNICRRSVPACRHYDITDILVAYWSANSDVTHLTRIIDYAALHPDLELYSTFSILLPLLFRYLMEDKRQTQITQSCTSHNAICLTAGDYQI